MYDKFKFPFDGLESIDQSYSQCLQDMFVLSALNGKRNGTFLEIGAYDATFISNTYLLEKDFGWSGISVDIVPSVKDSFKNIGRTAEVIIGDAVNLDYNVILSGLTGYRVDYLQLDIEPNMQTLNCLKKLPLDNLRFSVINYETDVYDPANSVEHNNAIREESRDILQSHGYILVAGNISNIDDFHPFEDWYLDSEYFDKDIINKFKRDSDIPIAGFKYMLGAL